MFGKNNPAILTFMLACLVSMVLVSPAAATTLKDSDTDGITDEAETKTYLTDPNNYDTDGDGYEDGYEVVNRTNPLDPKSVPGTAGVAESRLPASWTAWIIIISALIIIGLTAIFLPTSKATPAGQTNEKRDGTDDHPASN